MKTTLPLFALMSLLAAAFANAGERVLFDAPGHAAAEGAAVTARGGAPSAPWRLVDWRGREVEGASGAFDERGEATLPPLPAGYYRMVGGANDSKRTTANLATLAVVAPPGGAGGTAPRPLQKEESSASFFAADSAASYIAPGAFDCPWNGGDAIRTIADLAALAGIRHIRERMRWRDAQPLPDAPPDFSRCLAAADLFAARGIAISGCFHDSPPWAGRLKKLPGDLAALYRFCQEAATAFGDRMEDWEFWNEPDIDFAPEPVWDYAAALKAAYLGFKAARPEMPVLNGALCRAPSSAYEKALFANDAARYFDIFNYHTYAAISLYPDIFAKLRESLNNAVLTRWLRPAYPIWITECGTNNEGPATEESVRPGFTAHSPEQELVVAEYCAKANISLQMQGVARNYFFLLGAYSERGGKKDWGMLRRDGTVKPSYAALATQIRELGNATLLGALDAPAGIRSYLYEQPDGSQTVAFWAESPLDAAPANTTLVDAKNDCAQEWVLQPPAPAGGAPLRLVDMCGAVSAAAQDADAARPEVASYRLPATRYPAYVSGLRGLRASLPPVRVQPESAPPAPASPASPIVFRVDLAPGDFEISGSKTLAVAKVDAPRLRVQVWNLSGTAATGTVEAAGARLEGLPDGAVEIAPFGKAEFECALKPGFAGVAPATPSATLVLHGRFNGLDASRLTMPILFEPILLSSYESVELPWRDPAAWLRNDSATSYSATWDEAEQAVRFDVEWADPSVDRWFYPVLPLAAPEGVRGEESPRPFPLQGAVRAVFEVKTAQDKVENDFKNCGSNFMLVREGGKGGPEDYFPYAPPTGSWERRYIELSTADDGLDNVEAIRVGANPLGMRLTFWIRNVKILR